MLVKKIHPQNKRHDVVGHPVFYICTCDQNGHCIRKFIPRRATVRVVGIQYHDLKTQA